MSVRSYIGKLNKDGTIKAIYCHYDGEPDHNGEILECCYQDTRTINRLLSLGGLSSLGEDINSHDMVAYHRDHGEELKIEQFKSEKQFFHNEYVDYNYLWKRGQWYVNGKKLDSDND